MLKSKFKIHKKLENQQSVTIIFSGKETHTHAVLIRSWSE